MANPGKSTGTWKAKISRELVEYCINVVYLMLVFGVFTWYRRFLLAAHDISYTNYGVAVIDALVLGKVIMVGDVLRLGRGLEDKPLIYPTLYKTVVFTVFFGIFKVIEHVIKSVWTEFGLTGVMAAFSDREPEVVLANALVVFVGFIPFFAVKELARVLGEKKIASLFFRKRTEP